MSTQTLQRPPCDCGNPEAQWQGDRNGLREYLCTQCWHEHRAEEMHHAAAARVVRPGYDPDHEHFKAMADRVAHSWRGVFFDGPQSDQNHDGDEIPLWVVYVGNEHAEPVGTVYQFHNFPAAEQLAKQMSHDRRLELIHEANPD